MKLNGELRYGYTIPYPLHNMETNVQLHAPAGLPKHQICPWYPLDTGLVGHKSQSAHYADRKIPRPYLKSKTYVLKYRTMDKVEKEQ
jgi:hypothetical protein